MSPIKINEASIRWSITHLLNQKDTDIFPFPIELNIINDQLEYIIDRLTNRGLTEYDWNYARRFLISKDELSFRLVSQLDPIDSLFLTAVLKEYGQIIEDSRIPEEQQVVYGYRFNPTSDGKLYKPDRQWKQYWKRNQDLNTEYKYVLSTDIADFYNQIYHHSIENAILQIGGPNQLKVCLQNFINKVTYKVSRGIAVGPHATHLLAESVLISIDNVLLSKGIKYTRFMDDFVFFCNTELEAKIILNKFAQVLDKQGRLVCQRHKTKVFNQKDFEQICKSKLDVKSLSETEKAILDIIKKHLREDDDEDGEGDEESEYSDKLTWDDVSDEEKKYFEELYYEELFAKYLNNSLNPDYSKIRWLLRRLSQIGAPYAIQSILDNFQELVPVLPDVCDYFISSSMNLDDDLEITGEQLVDILDSEIVKSNEYIQISIIDLFVNNTDLNHFHLFDDLFNNSSEFVKRKIILLAFSLRNKDWIRGMKENFSGLGNWAKRALLIAFSCLPPDERKFVYNSISENLTDNNIMEIAIIKWGKIQ